jgi:hypothetical protein
MKRMATQSSYGSKTASRRHSYHRFLDNRKHAIRSLWRRNGKFVARITIEPDDGSKSVRWACGARERESIELRRDDVDFEHRLLPSVRRSGLCRGKSATIIKTARKQNILVAVVRTE